MFQQLHAGTDAEPVEAVAGELAWHDAVAVPPGASLDLCDRTLRTSRRVVSTHRLDAPRLQGLTTALAQLWAAHSCSQRLASTGVHSAMRALPRVGIGVETVRKVLRALARRYPTLDTTGDRAIIRLSVERRGTDGFALTKPQGAPRRLPEAGTT